MTKSKKFVPNDYPLSAYPRVRSIKFPESIPIAFAVCAMECGNRQFIVDGSTQICDRCGGIMFRTLVRNYDLVHARRKPKTTKPKASSAKGVWREYVP